MTTTVLLVDDDAATLLLCRRLLTQEGYTVLQAPGSTEALKLHTEHPSPIDLIVSEVVLEPPAFQLSSENNPYPRVNGMELVNRFLDSKRDVHILLMSRIDKDDLLKRGLVRPDLPFLQKPFTAEAFLAQVQQVLAAGPVSKPPKKDGSTQGVDWFG